MHVSRTFLFNALPVSRGMTVAQTLSELLAESTANVEVLHENSQCTRQRTLLAAFF